MEEAHRQFSAEYAPVQQERIQIPDQVYAMFVKDMGAQICALTDTPCTSRSTRGQAPRLRWVTVADRAQSRFPSWQTLDRPLHWICSWTQGVLRYLGGCDETDWSRARHLREELDDPPSEFWSVPALVGILIRARQLADA